MAFRYLIYSTGTTFATTIVRESATDNPGANEASYFTDFVIPEIQPLYLWRVDDATTPTTVIPNTDANITAYLDSIAPAPQPEDDATVGYVTGITSQKIDIVTGATGNLGTFNASGNLDNAGYTIAELTGLTTYSFVGSGGTQVTTNGNAITIFSTDPTGATVNWGNINGTLSAQTDLWNTLTAMTGETANKLDTSIFNTFTGTTLPNNYYNKTEINSYTGTTATAIGNKLDSSIFNAYTGTSQPILNAALTGVTGLGSGTTLGTYSGRNVTLKSISVLGGLSLLGDVNNIVISGETNAAAVWGNITGTLSNQTDLWGELTGKTDNSTFNTFTGTTLPNNYYNKTQINAYTATTEAILTGITEITNIALTGATNGLTPVGRNAELGGTLSKDTVVSGLSNNLTFNTKYIKLQAPNGIDIIDTDGVGGINIESDAGTISLIGNDSGSTEVNKISISETQMLITDGRATKVGIEYTGDYSSSFTNESLITKRYADSIAAGLIPKAAVKVATTTGITLSGLQTIDGIALSNGDRVLVKDQVSGETNGIYIASAGAWTRATDFDGNPDGEVSGGNIIPVTSGVTQYSTLWVLVTPNPIVVGTTDLEFTLFSEPHALIPGVGISINGNIIAVDGANLVGNSLSWTGNTFNVDVTSGTLSTSLASKLNITDFNTFSGTTLPNNYYNKTEINTFTGTTLPNTYYNKTEINSYTGDTDTRLDTIESNITGLSATTATKLDTAVFSAYTGTTAPNEIFLIHTGGTELNTIAATAIEWDSEEVSGAAFSWTGSSEIQILETGLYELSYNLPYNADAAASMAVGGNVILNNASVIDLTSAAGFSTDTGAAGNLALPTVILSLTANDVLNLATFRTGRSGSTISSPTGSILIKKKNTLQ